MSQINGFYLANSVNAMAKQMVGICVNGYITVFTFLIHISVIHRDLGYFSVIFQSVFFFCAFFYILAFLQLVSLYGYTFHKGRIIYILLIK